MATLKSRQMQIPGGFKFRQPEINWEPEPFTSFDRIVDEVLVRRTGNPHLARRYGWATGRAMIEVEVEAYNVRLCQRMGWTQYLQGSNVQPGGPPPPKRFAPFAALQNAVGGAKALAEWDISGEVVTEETAINRAIVCAYGPCPQNEKGDLVDWFTEQAAGVVRKQLEKKNERKLKTPLDDDLHICKACGCPMKLKVWAPMKFINAHLTPEQRAKLDKRCWILNG